MKFSIFNKHGALNSQPVFGAFQAGLDRLNLPYSFHDDRADVAVIWSMVWAGRMRANQTVWQQYRNSGRPVIVLEVGTIDRGNTWKVGLNGTGIDSFYYRDLDTARPELLNLDAEPWKHSGEQIVIATQRTDSEQWNRMPDIDKWLKSTVDTLKCYTTRPIVVRSHPRENIDVPLGCFHRVPNKIANTYDDYDFDSGIADAWAVINWNSGPGVRSVLAGIPAFVGPSSLAAPVANLNLSDIENPARPDRNEWLVKLSHTEWTLAEIATGQPLQRLLSLML